MPVRAEVAQGVARLLPDVDRPAGWLLTVDDAPQSYVDLDDPAHLEFEYTRRLGHVLDLAADPGAPLDLLHLGGGALTLARYAAAGRPGSRQHVVDFDGPLLDLVLDRLPLPADAAIETHATDARAWLEAAPDASADVLVADVFGGSRVPAALTSVDCARHAARVVRPGGTYTANLADGAPFAFLRGQLAGLRTLFAELAVLAEPAVLRGRRFGNVVVVASDAPLDLAGLTRRCAGDAFPARVVAGAELDRLIGRARPVTDAEALPSPPPPSGAFTVG
ncbi:spermidine synthase [Streptomyces sp. BI20]|uniref:spermidine synthase n=1 Tax=Streptomyces sp. BI20 TaxID=3403460 RepID=UPI003C7581AE